MPTLTIASCDGGFVLVMVYEGFDCHRHRRGWVVVTERDERALPMTTVYVADTPRGKTDWNKLREVTAMALRRRAERSKGGDVVAPLGTDQLMMQWPELLEHLTATQWPDGGGARETSTLTISTGEGRWRLCLRDRAEGDIAWVSGETLSDALEALDSGLAAGSLEWKPDRYSPTRNGKKK